MSSRGGDAPPPGPFAGAASHHRQHGSSSSGGRQQHLPNEGNHGQHDGGGYRDRSSQPGYRPSHSSSRTSSSYPSGSGRQQSLVRRPEQQVGLRTNNGRQQDTDGHDGRQRRGPPSQRSRSGYPHPNDHRPRYPSPHPSNPGAHFGNGGERHRERHIHPPSQYSRSSANNESAAVSSSVAIIPSASSSGYTASAASRGGRPSSFAPNAMTSSVAGGGWSRDRRLASLPPGVDIEKMVFLRVAENERVLAFMNHIGEKEIINAALEYVFHRDIDIRSKDPVPLLMARLQHYAKNGVPSTSIPAGVNQKLLPLSLAGDVRFLASLRVVQNPNVINAALSNLKKKLSKGRERVQNPCGFFVMEIHRFQKIEKQPLPDGVNEKLIPTDQRNDLKLRDYLIRIGDHRIINPALEETAGLTRLHGYAESRIWFILRKHEKLATRSSDEDDGFEDGFAIGGNDGGDSSSAVETDQASVREEEEETIDAPNVDEPTAAEQMPAETGGTDGTHELSPIGSVGSNGDISLVDQVDQVDEPIVAEQMQTAAIAGVSSGSNGEGGGDGGAGTDVGKAEKALKSIAAGGGRGARDVKSDKANLRGLSASDPSTVVIASINLLRASDGKTKRVDALLGALRMFLRRELKFDTSAHIEAFEGNQSILTCMETLCESNLDLASSFQSFGDKMKANGILSPEFIDKTFKHRFTTMLQEADEDRAEEEKLRATERRNEEDIQRRRAEADLQAAKAEAERREAEQRAHVRRLEEEVEIKAEETARAKSDFAARQEKEREEREATKRHEAEQRALARQQQEEAEANAGGMLGGIVGMIKGGGRSTKKKRKPLAVNSDAMNTPRDGVKSKQKRQTSKSPSPKKKPAAIPVASSTRRSAAMPKKKKKRPKSSSPQKKKKSAKKKSKKRKKDKNSSYEQALRKEAEYLNEDEGERSKRAGLGDVAPIEDPDSVADEPDLFGPVPEAHREYVGEAKAKFIDAIIAYIRKHDDYRDDKGRGKSIYLGNHLFLTLGLLDIDTLRSLAGLIKSNLSSMIEMEDKLKAAMKSCKFYYDTDANQFCDPSGKVLCEYVEEEDDENDELVYDLLSAAGVYYVFAYDAEDNLYAYSGGKFMSYLRFFDYANIVQSKINRLLDKDDKPPARIVFCCMAQLPFSGRLDLKNDEVPNTRNRIVEVVESAFLMALRLTIPGNQLYGDVRSMSAKEFVKWLKRRFKNIGWKGFDPDGGGHWSGDRGSNAGSKGAKVGALKGKPRKTSGDGAMKTFLDPSVPSLLAKFRFTTVNETEETEGSLRWTVARKDNGNVCYYLQAHFREDGVKSTITKSVDRDEPIYYLPPDEREPIEIGSEIEEMHPKPTPWVLIDGIDKKFSDSDIGDEMKRELEHRGELNGDNDEVAKVGIEQIRRNNVTCGVFVKFEKVWEAMGCEIVLNDTEKLFGSVISVARVLENDLPDVLKKKEAKKRIKARAKAEKAKEMETEETED